MSRRSARAIETSATRPLRRLAMLLVLAVSLPAVSAAEVPRRVDHVLPGIVEPVWLAAEEAADEHRRLDRDLLPRLVAGIERRGPLAPDECVDFGPSEVGGPPTLEDGFRPNRTLADLTAHSRAIYVGEVLAIGQGFYVQRPGALLEVRLEETLKRSPTFDPDDRLLIHYPEATFDAAGRRFCKEDPRYLPRPRVGDRIVVFADRPPLDRDRILISPGPTTMLVQRRGEDLAIPRQARAAADLQGVGDIAALARRIRSILQPGAPAE